MHLNLGRLCKSGPRSQMFVSDFSKSRYKISQKSRFFIALTYLFSDSSPFVNIFSLYTLHEVFSFFSIQEGGCTSVETDTMESE